MADEQIDDLSDEEVARNRELMQAVREGRAGFAELLIRIAELLPDDFLEHRPWRQSWTPRDIFED